MLLFQAYCLIATFAPLPRADSLPISRTWSFGMLLLRPQTGENPAHIELPLLVGNTTEANNAISRRQASAPGYRIAQFARYMPTIGARAEDGSRRLDSSRVENDGNNQTEVSANTAGELSSLTLTTKESVIYDGDDTPNPENIRVEMKQAFELVSNTGLQLVTPTSSDPTENEYPPAKTKGSSPERTEEPTKSSLGDNEYGNATVTPLPYTPGWCGLHVRQVYSYTCMRFNFKGCVSIISAIIIFDAAQKLIGAANVTLTYDTTNTYSLESVLPHPVMFTQLGILEGVAFTKETKPWETNMWPMRMNYNTKEWRNDDVVACRSGAWEHLNENRDFDCGFAC